MDSTEDLSLVGDKQWARKYVLDPLTAPEPSQETGPGSSFLRPLRCSQPQSTKGKGKSANYSDYPTPPSSTSPTSDSFHPSNPYYQGPRTKTEFSVGAVSTDADAAAGGRGVHFRAPAPVSSLANPTSPRYPPSPGFHRGSGSRYRHLPDDNGRGKAPNSNHNSLSRSKSAHHRRAINDERDPAFVDTPIRRSSSTRAHGDIPITSLRRNRSLSERYAGDMSHRPLDMLTREARAADRAPHLRRKHPNTDIIDTLDSAAIGGAYHHDGPYDATLASRNANPIYSPVAAVKESNIEALKATPREYVLDSLVKHVPLQGTATVPPGEPDMSGRIMDYREGADLMREPDAPGGPYKRWEGIPYLPEDLKGKGEPSYSIEKSIKEHKKLQKQAGTSGTVAYEMQPVFNDIARTHRRKDGGAMVRQRSISSAAAEGPSGPMNLRPSTAVSNNADIRRSNTTGAGKKIGEGLKRRFGSLRRRKGVEAEAWI